jgi:hypothetical protein
VGSVRGVTMVTVLILTMMSKAEADACQNGGLLWRSSVAQGSMVPAQSTSCATLSVGQRLNPYRHVRQVGGKNAAKVLQL